MIGEERSELVRPVGQGEKHVGDEARFLLDAFDAGPDVVWHLGQRRHRVGADRRLAG